MHRSAIWSIDGGPSSVDRRARESPRGSGRRGSLRGAAPRARSSRATVTRLSAATPSTSPSTTSRPMRRSACAHRARRRASRKPVARPEQAGRAPHQVADGSLVQRQWARQRGMRIDGLRRRRAARRHQPRSIAFSGAACGGCCIAIAGARAEHQAFEQRVARQAVGAVDAGAGHLAGGEQARQRRARPTRRCRRRPSCSAPPGPTGIGSRARSRPTCRAHRRRSSGNRARTYVGVEVRERQEHRPAGPLRLAHDARAPRRRAARDRRPGGSAP